MVSGPQTGSTAPRVALVAVAVLFTTLSLIVALRTPPWEASDEPSHVLNVETLLGGRWYRMEKGAGAEAHQAPLYYLMLAGWQRVLGEPVRLPRPQPNPNFVQCITTCFANQHGSPADIEDHRFVKWLRLPSILFGLITVLLTAEAARKLSPDPWTPVVAAAMVAGVPKFVFLSGVINNDNLSNVLGGLLTVLAIHFVLQPPQSWRWRLSSAAVLGVVVGLLTVTKLSAGSSALAVGVAAALVGRSWRQRAALAVAAAAGALLTCGGWLAQNYLRYGEWLATNASVKYLRPLGWLGVTQVDPFWTQLLVNIPRGVYRSFWYVSGWNQFSWPWWAYVPFWLALSFALAGLALRPRQWNDAQARGAVVLATVALAALSTIWMIGLQAPTFQARIAFVGLPAIGCLAALGLERGRLPVALRFAGPAIGWAGTVFAIEHDILRLL